MDNISRVKFGSSQTRCFAAHLKPSQTADALSVATGRPHCTSASAADWTPRDLLDEWTFQLVPLV
jgi:hypothetical protein